MIYQENFWVLLSKKLSYEANSEELHELEKLIEAHPEWQYAIQNLEDLWKHKPVKDFSHEDDAYMLHIHRMKEVGVPFGELPDNAQIKMKTGIIKWYWAAAAAILIAGLLVFGGFFNTKNKKEEIARQVNEISTRPGSKTRVKLPDGSVVWLNAGSKLTYDKDFGKETRKVTLVGEGFFDVTKNKEKPFIISTTSINIKVLGTVFNVKAYNEDKQTETSLLHGSIEVTINNRPNDKIILSPNEKLVVENKPEKNNNSQLQRDVIPDKAPLVAIKQLTYQNNDTVAIETSWTQNKLSFKNELFADVAKKMERWYDVIFEFENKRKENLLMYGTFTTETLQEALEALEFAFGFKYKFEHNKVTIF